MTLHDLGKSFDRALFLSFNRKKLLFVFLTLVLCGILIVFGRAIAFDTSKWVAMSLVFLPILLSSGILLSLGVLLIRVYRSEVKNIRVDYKKIIKSSSELILGTAYLSMPPILVYLFLWIVLGIFMLLKEIPHIGSFISIVLSFAPFLLILGSLLLVLFNLVVLFFVSPLIALKRTKRFKLWFFILQGFKEGIFANLVSFFVALFPISFVVGVLSLAAVLTGGDFLETTHSLSIGLKWFFIMIPFCVVLAPCIVFFFNFAAECYNFKQRKER